MIKFELFATPAAYQMLESTTIDTSPGTIWTTLKQGFTLMTYYSGKLKIEAVRTGWGNILVKTIKEEIPDKVVKFGEYIIEDDGTERARNCPGDYVECYGSLAVI